MYGWTAAEAVGRPITELTVLEDDAGVAAEILEQIAAEGRWEGEFTVRRKDGSGFVAQVSNALLTDERGAVVGVVGVSMDVTGHRQAEAELKRNQQLITAAFESSSIGTVIASPDLTIVSCNPAYGAILGVPSGDLIGRNVRDFTHPDDLDATTEALTGLVGGGADSNVVDKRYVRPDGQIVWGRLHVSQIYGEHGLVAHALGQVIDITEAKRSEDQIRFQASVLDQVHHAVTATDGAGIITYWNQRAETMFGWTETEVIGRNIREVLFPDTAPEFLADLYAAVTEHGTAEGEVAVTRKDGVVHTTQRVSLGTVDTVVGEIGSNRVSRIDVAGLSIAYRERGEGPPLVLLHGWPLDSREWHRQLDDLSDEFRVVAWDSPGAGLSSDPPDTSKLSDWADWLAEFIEVLGIAPAHVAGLSFGGGLALALFQRHPEVVRSLTLMSAYAGWGGSLPPEEVEARVASTLRTTELAPAQWAPESIETLLPEGSEPELADELTRMLHDFHPAATRTALHAFADADLRDTLVDVNVPTLLLYGELDKRSPRAVWEPIHAAIAHSKLVVIPGVGHMIDMQAPVRCNEEIRKFLRSA